MFPYLLILEEGSCGSSNVFLGLHVPRHHFTKLRGDFGFLCFFFLKTLHILCFSAFSENEIKSVLVVYFVCQVPLSHPAPSFLKSDERVCTMLVP